MVSLASLWLPIVVSAVIVFLASWIVHMFLPHHRNDFAKLPQEDAVLEALRGWDIPTGQYLAPYANTAAQMKLPEYAEKRKRGPALFLTLATGSDPGMGEQDHHAAGKPADELPPILCAERHHGAGAFSSPTSAILR